MTPMPAQLWVYRARPLLVVDGDTVDVLIDAGFRASRTERLRLLGLNTPEVRGESRPAGLAARAFVSTWLAGIGTSDWPLVIQTAKADAFGRYLATIWRAVDGCCLNDDILAAGHAVPFMVVG